MRFALMQAVGLGSTGEKEGSVNRTDHGAARGWEAPTKSEGHASDVGTKFEKKEPDDE